MGGNLWAIVKVRRLPCVSLLAMIVIGVGDARSQSPDSQTARSFVEQTERTLEVLGGVRYEAAWTAEVDISEENDRRSTEAAQAFDTELLRRAALARGMSASDPVVNRKLDRLKLSVDGVNTDPAARRRRDEVWNRMKSFYETACVTVDPGKDCLQHDAIEKEIKVNRDPVRLRRLWEAWYDGAAPQKDSYREYTTLANQGARDSARRDASEVSLAAYETEPAAFERELEVLWLEVKPLYRLLHAHARARLAARYPGLVDPNGPIPMHLLGNLWGQEWEGIADILSPTPEGSDPRAVAKVFAERGVTSRSMVEIAVRFFEGLGFPSLPASFWDKSFFTRPIGADGKPRTNFACHPSAWAITRTDWRIKACFDPTWAHFLSAHHETGHIFYNQSLQSLSWLLRDAPNEGINEAIGDAIALSVTPTYAAELGLSGIVPSNDIDALLRVALRKVARIPFGLALQRWRWGVQSGRITPDRYNDAWWELVREYQGIAPPAPRSSAAFDPAAKYHIAKDVDYVRYFLADVLTFQIHESLARAAGCTKPLHLCSAHRSKAAGDRLRSAMTMGAGQPWQNVLAVMTGSSAVKGAALRNYFSALEPWLVDQTRNVPIGW